MDRRRFPSTRRRTRSSTPFPCASDSAEHTAGRNALLEPIVKQNRALKLYYRTHRPVVDVDPDSGEPVGEPETDIETETEGENP